MSGLAGHKCKLICRSMPDAVRAGIWVHAGGRKYCKNCRMAFRCDDRLCPCCHLMMRARSRKHPIHVVVAREGGA